MKPTGLFRLALALILLVVSVQTAWAAPFGGGQLNMDGDTMNVDAATILYVPSQVADIQTAIGQVPDGGIIEVAGGTYPVPSGGLRINNLHKSFTIRAAANSTVVLDGGGGSMLLRFQNSDLSTGGPVTFEGLTFANGVSTRDGLAGGVTLNRAQATFVNSTFQNNAGNQPAAGAGGAAIHLGSTAFFFNTTFTGNTAKNYGGAMTIGEQSTVFIHASRFINNRTNLPGHSPTAAGGGIHVGNSRVRVTNTRFENNQAGYVGGAFYAIGTWTDPVTTPQADILIANSTFVGNQAARDASVSFGSPTEGGAFHAEDQTVARIYNSRFILNSSQTGGGVNLYRANVEIEGSVFLGNRATGSGSANGFGGAISAISNDGNDASTGGGGINRPAARLTVRSTYIQGRYGGVGVAGQAAGGIYVAGDTFHAYGIGGVPVMGSPAENRAVAVLQGVVLNDLDVQELANAPGTGIGGAITTDLANLTVQYSLILNSDALGTGNSSGGGVTVLNNSAVTITDSLLARNTSEKFGGALFVQGSTINLSNSKLVENAIKNTNYGAAIFAAPDDGRKLPANGVVESNGISNNSGHLIFDDDRTNGPINDIRYNSNQIYHQGGATAVIYTDSVPNTGWLTVAQLNDLVVQRANGTATDKAQAANTALGQAAVVALLGAAPQQFLSATAAGDPENLSQAYLAYAWSGGPANLDGQGLNGNAGATGTRSTGTHTLSVGGATSTVEVSQAPAPAASLNLSGSALSWSVNAGTFLDAGIDQGVSISPAASGSVQVANHEGRPYRFLAVTKEGGAFAQVSAGTPLLSAPDAVTFLIGLNGSSNRRSIQVANLGGGVLAWSARSNDPDLIQVDAPTGTTEAGAPVPITIKTGGLGAGTRQGSITIDAGAAGTKTVQVTLQVVESLRQLYMPFVGR